LNVECRILNVECRIFEYLNTRILNVELN